MRLVLVAVLAFAATDCSGPRQTKNVPERRPGTDEKRASGEPSPPAPVGFEVTHTADVPSGSPTRQVPPLALDPDSLRVPPAEAPHGTMIDGLTLGLWSESDTYQLNSVMNVWTILVVGKRIPYDVAIHNRDWLHIRGPGGRTVRVPLHRGGDGWVGIGFASAHAYTMHRHLREAGVYELQWKVGDLESNVLTLTVVEPRN